MNITKADLTWAASQGIVSPAQADALWQAWQERYRDRPRFSVSNVAYYFGALVVISGMTWFMTLAWESFGGGGIFVISCLYALCFVLAGRTLWFQQQMKIPGGLLITVAVCMTPLAIYGFQQMTGLWFEGDPGSYQDYHIWIKSNWLWMELGTILAGAIALRFFRFPFLTAPIAYTLWYMSMDLTPLLFGQDSYTWEQACLVSLWFGLACLVVAFLVDRHTRRREADFAFWLYLFGLMSFWSGMTLMGSGDEWQRFIYCLINLGLIALSVILRRRVFIVFGAIGIFTYLSHLAYSVFQDALLFPFSLTILGVTIIYLGILYQRYQSTLERTAWHSLPKVIRDILPEDSLE